MKQLFFVLITILLVHNNTFAQVSISTDNSLPEASAMLHVKSKNKGILIPRMTTNQRNNITNPANGLLVFDNITNTFWFYQTNQWLELAPEKANQLIDNDNDTKVQVEASSDEDMVRFELEGSERMTLNRNEAGITMLEFPNGGGANLFIGSFAGDSTASGTLNTFVGNASGQFNKSGSYNTFFGRRSGYSNISGHSNTIMGNAAGHNNKSGNYNVYLGQACAKLNETGTFNTFVGSNSGESVTSGSDNVYLGYYAARNNSTGSRNVCIGYKAGQHESGDYKLYIEPSNSSSPLIYGEFDNDLVRINGTLNSTGNITGNDDLFLNQGSQSFAIIPNPTNNYVHIDIQGATHSSDNIVIGEIGAGSDNHVGIGTDSPSYLLEVDGTAGKPGGGSWTAASDRRLKQDISPYTDGLEAILNIRPVRYHYNEKSGFDTQPEYIGILAQELKEVAPYMVGSFEKNGETFLDVDNSAMTYMLINAVQELSKENENLKAQMSELKAQADRISKLEAMLEIGN